MIHFVIYILIVALISMMLFDLTSGIYKYVILAIFGAIFGITSHYSNFYLDLPLSGFISLVYFLFIILLGVIRINLINYIIVALISLSFIFYWTGATAFSQGFINFAFYSIIILVIRLIFQRNN